MKYFNYKTLILLIFAIIYLLTLTHYGLSWDETLHIVRGKEVVDFFTGKKEALSFAPHGVIVDTVGYLSIMLFHQKLKLLPVDASFHLPILPIALIGLWALMKFTEKFIGKREAFLAAFFLCTMPRFIGHSHQNIKDIPMACLFALSIYAFTDLLYKKEKKLTKKYLFAGLSFGLALAVKINALQIIPIILFSLFFIILKKQKEKIFLVKLKKAIINFLPSASTIMLVFLLGTAFATLLWPNLWPNPFEEGKKVISFFNKVWQGNPILYFGHIYYGGKNIPWHYPLGLLFVTTPVLTLLLSILGIFIALRKSLKGNTVTILLLAWLFIPLLKYLNPKVPIYDDIRQFMEVLFPLAILAALSVTSIWRKLSGFFKTHLTKTMYILTVLIYSLLFVYYYIVPFILLHPYDMIFFNGLVGRKKGVYEKGLFDIDFWSISIKEATLWVNERASKNAIIAIPFGEHIAFYYIRPDLTISYQDFDNAEYLIIQNRHTFMTEEIKNLLISKKPVYTIIRRDAPLCWIYKLK